jgi:DHA1 family bicyclomycin/chloramphenicol resistance-like MFS transporter
VSARPGAPSPEAASPQPPVHAGVLITAVLAGMAMLGPFSIDTPFPAFPAMREAFGVGVDQMQLVVSAYMFAFAAMTPFHGPLSDALGRRPVIIGGLTAYVLASIGCALAPSLPVLLAFRVLQGLSAGGATIIGRTIVRDLYDGPEAQRLMSTVMMIFGVAPAIAPVIGGWLLQWGTWPWIFWFIAAFGLMLIVAVLVVIPETHPPERRTPVRLGPMLANLWRVGTHGDFLRMSGAMTLAFAGQFLYVGAAAIFVVDLLGKGEGDFWMFFVPMISGIVLGASISRRAAGRVSGRRLVTAALSFSVVAAIVNIVLAQTFGPTLPYAVIGPALIALGTGTAFPTVQIALLDVFPDARGAAASVAGVLPLMLNATLAAVLTPLVTGSVVQLAVASAVLCILGVLVWLWHLQASRTDSQPPPGPGPVIEPLDQV